MPLSIRVAESVRCCRLLRKLLSSWHVSTVHTFIPLAEEVNILPLITELVASDITVAVPKTETEGRLTHWILDDMSQLQIGRFGTSYPKPAQSFQGQADAILVPGLAFDPYGNRIGFGAGYYDQFLHQASNKKVGVLYTCQLSKETLPCEPFDVPMDYLVCDKIISAGLNRQEIDLT